MRFIGYVISINLFETNTGTISVVNCPCSSLETPGRWSLSCSCRRNCPAWAVSIASCLSTSDLIAPLYTSAAAEICLFDPLAPFVAANLRASTALLAYTEYSLSPDFIQEQQNIRMRPDPTMCLNTAVEINTFVLFIEGNFTRQITNRPFYSLSCCFGANPISVFCRC